MPIFSERLGLRPVRKMLQLEEIDDDLRASLWNQLYFRYLNSGIGRVGVDLSSMIARDVWINHLFFTADDMPTVWDAFRSEFKEIILEGDWREVYDLVEYIVKSSLKLSDEADEVELLEWAHEFNDVLERHMSGYRFVGPELSPIVGQHEIGAIELASSQLGPFVVASTHINRALELLSDRSTPDYRNSIKESISAVESVCTIIAGRSKASLGEALRALDGPGGVPLNPALRKALDGLYGYSSGGGGIRHALLEASDITREEAVLMLVTCSAFVNYLIAKAPDSIPSS